MIVRPHILRILLGKELRRFKKNPTAIMLFGLLTLIAVLMAAGAPRPDAGKSATQPATCWVVYWEQSPWIEHLQQRLPDQLPVRIVSESRIPRVGDELLYPPGDCAIEVYANVPDREGILHSRIRYRYSGADETMLWPYARWFWSATVEHFGNTPEFIQEVEPLTPRSSVAAVSQLAHASISELFTVDLIGTMLLFVVQFFTCCHLLVAFTSQDRERGVLRALGLTPATPTELLMAKFIFHLGLSLAASGLIVGILRPQALAEPILWFTLICASLGFLAVGTIIVSLARTQATAGLLTLCYMLGTGVVFFLASELSTFALVQQAMFERYSFPLTFFSLRYPNQLPTTPGMAYLAVLVAIWMYAACYVFHRRAWQ
jgi:ABC-type transport system involved in multi-copper enzyme maturation permease subunit